MKLKGDIGIILTSNITDSCCSEFEWEIRCLFILTNLRKKTSLKEKKIILKTVVFQRWDSKICHCYSNAMET